MDKNQTDKNKKKLELDDLEIRKGELDEVKGGVGVGQGRIGPYVPTQQ